MLGFLCFYRDQIDVHFIHFRVNGIAKALKLEPLTKYNIQVLGSEQTYGPHADPYIAQVRTN